ncbi:unnamed protein product [Ectocarpus sp. 13 AM-2016]
MMNFGKMPTGRTASRLARVVSKSESSIQSSVRAAGSMNALLSTRSGLTVTQSATRLAAVKLPVRHMSGQADYAANYTADQKAVDAATRNWRDNVTANTEDAPKKTAAIYADDALFWGTVSEQVRNTPEHVYDYFDFFARMPKLSMVAYDPAPPRIHGDFAIHAGAYTFAWAGADGAMTETRARFTFAYRRENGKWVMVEHHSSAMPTAPPGLKPAQH